MSTEAEAVYEPISLGYSCETKYQIARVAKGRLYPKQSEMAFRYAIRQPDHASSFFGWRLFDWQSTPLETVCDYIERDFEGVFELEDFQVTFDYGVPAHGGAVNTRFETVYIHEFFPIDPNIGVTTAAQIEQHYPQARRRFERLVADFRTLLTLPGPYLYTIAHPTYPRAATLQRLIDLLSSRSPDHQFALLVVGREGHDSDLSSLGNRVTKAWRSAVDADKPPHLAWEGDDASWDRAMAPFRLGFHPHGLHDPGPLYPAGDAALAAAEPRPSHANFPTARATVVWERGGEAVYANDYWRRAGARLQTDGCAATIVSPPIAWHYSHAVTLDMDQIDIQRDRAWVRVVVEDVGGGPLLASLFDPEQADALAEETLIDQGPGPFEIILKVRDGRKSVLLFRTGARAESGQARVMKIEVLRDRG